MAVRGIRKHSEKFGLFHFILPLRVYQELGEVFDHVYENFPEAAASGAFVGRLDFDGPSFDKWTADQVAEIKKTVRQKARRSKLKAVIQQRKENAELLHVFHDSTVIPTETDLDKLWTDFCNYDFHSSPNSLLCEALGDHRVKDCNQVFGDLLRSTKDIMYAVNLNLDVDLSIPGAGDMRNQKNAIETISSKSILGITRPSIYLGTEGSLFPLHIEDRSFLAVNRHVAGAPKIWFIVPPQYFISVYNLLRDCGVPEEEINCANFLQHKFTFLDPAFLVRNHIPVHTIIQRPGDIVFLFPNTIHFGYNLNFNIVQSQNLVSRCWKIPGMLSTPRCKCSIVAKSERGANHDITRALENVGASEEEIADFKSRNLLKHKQKLPLFWRVDSGIPDPSKINLGNLYGPQYEDTKFFSTSISLQGISSSRQITINVQEEEPPEPSQSFTQETTTATVPTIHKCISCSKQFFYFCRLKAHYKHVHGMEPVDKPSSKTTKTKYCNFPACSIRVIYPRKFCKIHAKKSKEKSAS